MACWTMKPVKVGILLLLATGAVSAAAAASARKVASMTLQESDLPSAFSEKFSHSVPKVQVQALQGSMVPRYIDAWQREFTRVQGVNTAAVTSSVLRYESPAKAHDAFVQTWKQVAKRSGAKPFRTGVGSESRAFTYPKGPLSAYAVVWRYKNVNAIVLSVGLTSLGATQQSTKELALKQQTHMKTSIG
jgi:hypothetical protein